MSRSSDGIISGGEGLLAPLLSGKVAFCSAQKPNHFENFLSGLGIEKESLGLSEIEYVFWSSKSGHIFQEKFVFKLHRAFVSQCGMQSNTVVKHFKIIDHLLFSFLSCGVHFSIGAF